MAYQNEKDLCFKNSVEGPEGRENKILGGFSQQILEKPTAIVVAFFFFSFFFKSHCSKTLCC